MEGGANSIKIDEEKNKIPIQLKYKSFDLINNLYTYEGYILPYGSEINTLDSSMIQTFNNYKYGPEQYTLDKL